MVESWVTDNREAIQLQDQNSQNLKKTPKLPTLILLGSDARRASDPHFALSRASDDMKFAFAFQVKTQHERHSTKMQFRVR